MYFVISGPSVTEKLTIVRHLKMRDLVLRLCIFISFLLRYKANSF